MAKELTKRDCVVCRKGFEAKRADARFCSPNCRQKHTRNPQPYMIGEALKEQKKATIPFKEPPPQAFDGPKLPSNFTKDEVGQFQQPKKEGIKKPFMNEAIRKKLGI